MPRRRSKHEGREQAIVYKPTGGVNLSVPPGSIADNQLVQAYNWIYAPQSAKLLIRPGFRCVTATPFPGAIRSQQFVQFLSSSSWAVASNGKLWSQDETGNYTEIGALTSADGSSSMLQFNQKLLVADDSASGVRYWDGTTYGYLTGSPANPTALLEVANRVLANSGAYPDLLYITGPEDDVDWDPAASGSAAAIVPCGFGDGQDIVAIASYGREVIIAKRGTQLKALRRFSMSGDMSTWSNADKPFSTIHSARNNKTLIGTANGVYFFDSDGFKAVAPTEKEGGLEVSDKPGEPMNGFFVQNYYTKALETVYCPAIGCVACLMEGNRNLWLYWPFNNAWTEIGFPLGIAQPTSIAASANGMRIGTEDGYIYEWNNSFSSDEVGPGVFESVTTALRTKEHIATYEALQGKVDINCLPNSICTGSVYAVSSDNGLETKLFDFEIDSARLTLQELGNIQLSDWLERFGETRQNTTRKGTRARWRDQSIQYVIRTTSGRMGLDSIRAEIAMVG